jgi:flavin-dependent dehydrogenase
MVKGQASLDHEVVIIGGGLLGAVASVLLQRRGIRALVLEARSRDQLPKAFVGEAVTEGTCLVLSNEVGLRDWLATNCFRKYGLSFIVQPRGKPAPQRIEDCHEFVMSQVLLRDTGAPRKLIPVYHVDRKTLDGHVTRISQDAGIPWIHDARVQSVEIDETGQQHRVHFAVDGVERVVSCRWVVDCSGRRALLAHQLGEFKRIPELDTASVWNRFTNVDADPGRYRTFRGIDRRRQTTHYSSEGFWAWWIHQSDTQTSVGVSFDNRLHQPNLKTKDKGFWEMVRKFPALANLLEGATPLEPYQYFGHLAYRCDQWISSRGYCLIGDASWFADALYSTGLDNACRQLMNALPLICGAVQGRRPAVQTVEQLNSDFDHCVRSIFKINAFKYQHAWKSPYLLAQTAIYELGGEIAQMHRLQNPRRWTPKRIARDYRLQWYSRKHLESLERFLENGLADAERDLRPNAPLLKKAVLIDPLLYYVTWPIWQIPGGVPFLMRFVQTWAYLERLAQRAFYWPDVLRWMALPQPGLRSSSQLVSGQDAGKTGQK